MTKSDMPMIERIARAIAENRGAGDWRSFLPAARAAVSAMREPTTDMLDAATPPEANDYGYLPEEWQAMIDHIAAEKPN